MKKSVYIIFLLLTAAVICCPASAADNGSENNALDVLRRFNLPKEYRSMSPQGKLMYPVWFTNMAKNAPESIKSMARQREIIIDRGQSSKIKIRVIVRQFHSVEQAGKAFRYICSTDLWNKASSYNSSQNSTVRALANKEVNSNVTRPSDSVNRPKNTYPSSTRMESYHPRQVTVKIEHAISDKVCHFTREYAYPGVVTLYNSYYIGKVEGLYRWQTNIRRYVSGVVPYSWVELYYGRYDKFILTIYLERNSQPKSISTTGGTTHRVESVAVPVPDEWEGIKAKFFFMCGIKDKPKQHGTYMLHCKADDYQGQDSKISIEAGRFSQILLTGLVTDVKAAVIPGATLQLTCPAVKPGLKPVVLTSKTNPQGQYSFTIQSTGTQKTKASPVNFKLVGIVQAGVTGELWEMRRGRDCKLSYMPVSSTSKSREVQLRIKALDKSGKPLQSSKAVLRIINTGRLPFITVANRNRTLDKSGSCIFNISVRKPTDDDATYIRDIPLRVSLKVDIEKPGQKKLAGTFVGTYMMGMCFFHGQTVGPDWKPRYNADAPEVIHDLHLSSLGRRAPPLHIMGDIAPDGKFESLARIPEEGEPKTKIYLKWPDICRLELFLPVKQFLTPGLVIDVGDVDLLNYREHEARVKKYIADFIQEVPLTAKAKGRLLQTVNGFEFSYYDTATVPSYTHGTIYIPGSPAKFWGEDPMRIHNNGDPAYVLVFHEFCHGLHQTIIEMYPRVYFVRKYLITMNHDTWTPPTPKLEPKGLICKITAFNEATADFSAYLVYQYILQHKTHSKFEKSVHWGRGYFADFDKNTKAIAASVKGGWQVEGVQSTFLRALYQQHIAKSAPIVYADFLRTMALWQQESFLMRWVPARTIEEWALMKKKHGGIGHGLETLTHRLNIFEDKPKFYLLGIPLGTCIVSINGGVDRDLLKQRVFQLAPKDRVEVKSGNVYLEVVDPKDQKLRYLFASAGTTFKINSATWINVFVGAVLPVGLNIITPAGDIIRTKTTYFVRVDTDGKTHVQVLDGSVDIKIGDKTFSVNEGQAVIADKAGNVAAGKIEKPRSLEQLFVPSGTAVREVVDFGQQWREPQPETHHLPIMAPDGNEKVKEAVAVTVKAAAPPPPPSVSSIIHQTLLLDSIPPTSQNQKNIFSPGDMIYVWVESRVLNKPHKLEIAWMDPSGKEVKRETFDLRGWGARETFWSELQTGRQMMQGRWKIKLLTDGKVDRSIYFILKP